MATAILEETTEELYIDKKKMRACWTWLDKHAVILDYPNTLITSRQAVEFVNDRLAHQVTHHEFMAACIEAGYTPKKTSGERHDYYLNIEFKA